MGLTFTIQLVIMMQASCGSTRASQSLESRQKALALMQASQHLAVMLAARTSHGDSAKIHGDSHQGAEAQA